MAVYFTNVDGDGELYKVNATMDQLMDVLRKSAEEFIEDGFKSDEDFQEYLAEEGYQFWDGEYVSTVDLDEVVF